MSNSEFGILVTSSAGSIRFAQGLGVDPRTQQQLIKAALARKGAMSGVETLDAEGGLVAAWRSDSQGMCFIVQRAGAVGGVLALMAALAPQAATALAGLAEDPERPRHATAIAVRAPLPGLGRRPSDLDQMIGQGEALQQLKSDIAKIAPLNVPVLIVGESGTGKELAAQAIHALSARSDKQMVFVNAAALPGGLVESELFGYEPGAFTGAERTGRKGKFELADKSSLFFDEVGDMPTEIQVKLLRVLQDGMFERVGSHRAQRSDFRLISATNRNFQEMIASGEFRLDLYYRISGVTVRMPSLRERLEDIPLLVRHFLDAFAERHRTQAKGVGKGVVEFLSEHPWPGNVRQLLHEVEKAAIFCDEPEISLADLRLLGAPVESRSSAAPKAATPTGTLQDAVAEMEKTMIRDAMKAHRGNKKRVAEILGISRAYLYKKLGEA